MTRALLDLIGEYYDIAWKEGFENRHHDDEQGSAQKKLDEIRTHLAPPQGEPVAWRRVSEITGAVTGFFEHDNVECRSERLEPLFTHPTHTEAEVQELYSFCDDSRYPDLCEDTIRRILGVPAP